MNRFESLLQQASDDGVAVYEIPMIGHDGLYGDNTILLNSDLKTTAEKTCILAEELGHHYTAAGDITGTSAVARKQERIGRKCAYEQLVPINDLAAALRICRSKFEIAEQLDVTEEFLSDAIEYYFQRHGHWINTKYGAMCLSPLGLLRKM